MSDKIIPKQQKLKNKQNLSSIDSIDADLVSSSDITADARTIIESCQRSAYRAINISLIRRNWLLGRRISDELLGMEDSYGKGVVKKLSETLSHEYGNSFSARNLYSYVRFYNLFPDILNSLSSQSPIVSWTHYRALLRVTDKKARDWYLSETIANAWSVRTLERNISTQYYYRMLKTPNPEAVKSEMESLTKDYQNDKLEFIKNPVVAEFLGLSPNTKYLESDLETAIIDNLQKFLLELGRGYAFVARQQHIRTELNDFYIDLVFYNFELDCFILIDLKTGQLTHQDVGQMDMYVKMYDERMKPKGKNPTLGIILCNQTDADVVHYSILNDKDQLFAARYLPYLPSEEELRAEIESQKAIFYSEHPEAEPKPDDETAPQDEGGSE